MSDAREHTCHAHGCDTPCKPEHLMCREHWYQVPVEIRERVWFHYRPGQCEDKRPSAAWMRAAEDALDAVVRQPTKEAKR